jgi:tripartite-type tricarboxylate transporter receptor subunit TctC
MPKKRFSALSLSGAALALALAAGPAAAQSDLFAGKTISIVVGFTPGGGYDAYARVMQRHFANHIPGKPTVIIQNMPGAGSLTAVKYLNATAPIDGTVMSVFNNGLIVQSLTIPDKVDVKFTDLAWVGSITPDYRVCYAWGATGIKTWQDMMARKEFVLGSTGKGSGNYVNGSILRQVFKAPVKQILGFPGSAEQRLAIERGELDGDCGSWTSIPVDWIKENKINSFVRFSAERASDIPESARFVGEFATTQRQKDLLELLSAGDRLGRPLVMSKRVPAERMKIIRDAFDATMKDPAFIEDARRQNLLVDPTNGDEAAKIVAKVASFPADLITEARDITE